MTWGNGIGGISDWLCSFRSAFVFGKAVARRPVGGRGTLETTMGNGKLDSSAMQSHLWLLAAKPGLA